LSDELCEARNELDFENLNIKPDHKNAIDQPQAQFDVTSNSKQPKRSQLEKPATTAQEAGTLRKSAVED